MFDYIMWSDISLYYEPREFCLSQYKWPDKEPEMTIFESAFLCGLIKERKPQKIVEVGIAGGGTTAIILKCLDLVGIADKCEVISIDVSEKFYRNNGEKSGYLAQELLDEKGSCFNHKFILGRYLPQVLNEIGDQIDFVILDTVHNNPGELLDFMSIYPYLKNNACIVLHDIIYNHHKRNPFAFATQLLYSCVAAQKVVCKDVDREDGYPNIGAFIVNEDTKKYLSNVMTSLLITWRYLPSKEEFNIYHDHYMTLYGDEYADLFETIYKMQSKTIKQQTWNSPYHKIANLIELIQNRVLTFLKF